MNQGAGSADATADMTAPDLGARDALGFRSVSVSVTNHSSKRSSYFIEFAIESPDGATQCDTSSGAAAEHGRASTIQRKGVTTFRCVGACPWHGRGQGFNSPQLHITDGNLRSGY